ncbi:hypothetical protein CDG62_09705 [Acinetobacter sp. WCHA55]|uniref:hypothetical protein n=1 Tax=Acinetobacter sp. WCHA55 TaxID=2004646 RepID=UPI000B3CCBC2|nr:hypothetical protein [Acinetobacter sp. WCHA55]AYA68597.1 hypothetical protein CDG62_09705 [Acinetobacter sp. WCHA55]
MAMKQTQTKMFDFADVGLDFCAGSKTLFPDRFKKMLSQGYNEQTVASVSVTGDQVTLNYGVAHGYAADRVLKINSGALAAINGGEFWIDSVTATSVTMTIDAAPISLSGGFVTKIASLGWEIVYEAGLIQIFKFKNLNEEDLYLRIAHQALSGHRNTMMPCVGKTVDLDLGVITDQNAYVNGRSGNNAGQALPKWDFTAMWTGNYNNYTYSQGYSILGNAIVVGSRYHFLALINTEGNLNSGLINGIVPAATINYSNLNYPILFLYDSSASDKDNRSIDYSSIRKGVIGNILCNFVPSNSTAVLTPLAPQAASSYLPSTISGFNTTTTELLPIYEESTKQFLGYAAGGIYIAKYGASNTPPRTKITSPSKTMDVDLNNLVYLHTAGGPNSTSVTFYAVPIEEIKIVT